LSTRPITTSLADVAARAGVSVATASRVLAKSSHPVSSDARARVVLAAGELDYEHNMLARGLVGHRTRTVGVVLHDVLDEYFALIVRGIEDVAYAAGYTTLMCNSDRDPDKELNYVRKLRSMCVDAIIFTAGGLVDAEHQRRLAVQTEKIELAGRVVVHLAPDPVRKPAVYYSTTDAMRQLVEHLQGLGHRQLLYVAGSETIATTSERIAALRAVARAAHLPRPAIVHSDFSREGGRLAAKTTVEHMDRGVTAVLATNDQTALGLLEGLAELNVKVPRDVSVTGFGDISVCRDVTPSLTTMRLPLYELGAQGMQHTLRLLDQERPRRQTALRSQLVVRASTAEPRPATK
jgi:LacI family transcriptional regulator